jgi:hypothetical protein
MFVNIKILFLNRLILAVETGTSSTTWSSLQLTARDPGDIQWTKIQLELPDTEVNNNSFCLFHSTVETKIKGFILNQSHTLVHLLIFYFLTILNKLFYKLYFLLNLFFSRGQQWKSRLGIGCQPVGRFWDLFRGVVDGRVGVGHRKLETRRARQRRHGERCSVRRYKIYWRYHQKVIRKFVY